MYHFIYKVTSPSGKYYVGRHSTKNLEDGYMGSGLWVKSIKDKTKLVREIVEFCDSFDDLLTKEEKILSENVGKPNCMNYNSNPVGWASGDKNPAYLPHVMEKRRERMITNNISKLPGVGEKISKANKGKTSPMKGKSHSEQSKRNMSIGRTGSKMSDAGRIKLSEARKRQWKGESFYSWEGKNHSDETKQKQSESAKNKQRIECEFCKGLFMPHTYTRWHGNNCRNRTGT